MFKTIAKASILRGCGSLISFASTFLVAGLFDANGLGIYQLTLSVLLGIGIIFRYGLDFLALKEVSVANKTDINLTDYIYASLLVSIVTLTITLSIYHLLPFDLHGISFPFAYLSGVAMASLLILVAYLKATSRPLSAIFHESLMWQLILLAGIIGLYLNNNKLTPKSLSIAFLAAVLTSFSSAIFSTRANIKFSPPIPAKIYDKLSNAFPLFLFSIFAYINGSLGLYLAGIFFHTTGAGLYSLPQKLLMLFSMFASVLNAIYFPKLALCFKNIDKEGFFKLLKQYYFYNTGIGLIIATTLLLSGKILPLVNEGFSSSIQILKTLLLGQCFTIVLGNFGPILLIIDRTMFSLLGLTLSSIFMIAFVAMTQEHGIITVAWAWTASSLIGGSITLAGMLHTIKRHFSS